jgi:hypothetical protein
MVISDSSIRHGISSTVFFEQMQHACTHLEQLVCAHVTYAKPLRLSSALRRLEYFTMIHTHSLLRLTIPAALERLDHIMIVNVPNLEVLDIAPECVRLQEMTLAQMRLREFTLRPEWTSLRVLSLRDIGFIPELCIPASYTQLRHIHLVNIGLHRLCIRVDVSKRHDAFERLTIRLHDTVGQGRVHIVTSVENQKGIEIYSSMPTEFHTE